MATEIESYESEVYVDISFDVFMKNFIIGVHSEKPLTPQAFLEELREVVARYENRPEELFDEYELMDPQ